MREGDGQHGEEREGDGETKEDDDGSGRGRMTMTDGSIRSVRWDGGVEGRCTKVAGSHGVG